MSINRFFALVACAAIVLPGGGTQAFAAGTDPTQFIASPLPGYAKVQEKCLRCHNAESMAYQPADAPRAHWETMVKRMKRVFKARLDDAEMADIVDYLTKTYGNEK